MYQCPKCRSSEILNVDALVDASLSAAGELECLHSNLRFEATSRIDCGVCGHHGPASSFVTPATSSAAPGRTRTNGAG